MWFDSKHVTAETYCLTQRSKNTKGDVREYAWLAFEQLLVIILKSNLHSDTARLKQVYFS